MVIPSEKEIWTTRNTYVPRFHQDLLGVPSQEASRAAAPFINLTYFRIFNSQ